MALAALAAATKDFKGDSKRTYLTGLSMGGYASWDIASRYPGKFAAIVPVCGGLIPPARVLKLFPELAKEAYPDDPEKLCRCRKQNRQNSRVDFPRRRGSHRSRHEFSPDERSLSRLQAATFVTPNIPVSATIPGTKPIAEPALMPWLLSKSLP